MTTLYVAGPMTGKPAFNYPAFNDAADELHIAGYRTLNPARRGVVPGKAWQTYLREAIADLVQADHVAVLPGWEWSRGAKLEVYIARSLGMRVRSVDAWVAEPAGPELCAICGEPRRPLEGGGWIQNHTLVACEVGA